MKIVNTIKISINFLILICLSLFFGCSGNNSDELEYEIFAARILQEEMEIQIKQDYFNAFIKPDFPEATIDDVWIEAFYGVHGAKAADIYAGRRAPHINPDAGVPKVAVIMGSNFNKNNDIEWKYKIDSTLFKGNGNPILVWRKGKFYELQETRRQFLSNLAILNIANYHNGLSMEVARQISSAMFQYYMNIFEDNPDSLLDLKEVMIKDGEDGQDIMGYFGTTSNGYVAVQLGIAAIDYIISKTIAGVTFVYDYGNMGVGPAITIWKEEQNYGIFSEDIIMLNMYNRDLLTDDDIKMIHYYHKYYYFSDIYEHFEL